MGIPAKILIVTDSNELEYSETKLVSKVPMLYYRYTKSITKLDTLLPLTNEQLEKMIKNNIAKIL